LTGENNNDWLTTVVIQHPRMGLYTRRSRIQLCQWRH